MHQNAVIYVKTQNSGNALQVAINHDSMRSIQVLIEFQSDE
jgi:hypothetical protein